MLQGKYRQQISLDAFIESDMAGWHEIQILLS